MRSLLALLLFSGLSTQLYAQDDEVCGAEEAWGGDTAAMRAFLASCGRIDTVNLDENNQPAPESRAHRQTIKMVLHSGKVLRTDSIYFYAQTMPQFPGGETALFQYLKKSVVYPALARQQKVTGRVYVQFIIERDGSVSNVKVIRGIGSGCNEEAARVVKQMPKWSSGKIKNAPVRVQYTMPVNFTL